MRGHQVLPLATPESRAGEYEHCCQWQHLRTELVSMGTVASGNT